jgi:integrase
LDENIISRNPCETVRRIREPETELEFLNIDEVQRLADVKLDGGGAEIRRAFLFACHTGLRVSDLETLTWNKIETNPMQIAKQQTKTKAPVYIPLSGTAIKLIDNGGEHGPADRVFNLPVGKRRLSYNILKRWAKAAGLTKNIGWHTARRTFATLALENGGGHLHGRQTAWAQIHNAGGKIRQGYGHPAPQGGGGIAGDYNLAQVIFRDEQNQAY